MIEAALSDDKLIYQVEATAGSVLLFAEALIHSTTAIRSDKEARYPYLRLHTTDGARVRLAMRSVLNLLRRYQKTSVPLFQGATVGIGNGGIKAHTFIVSIVGGVCNPDTYYAPEVRGIHNGSFPISANSNFITKSAFNSACSAEFHRLLTSPGSACRSNSSPVVSIVING